MLLGMLKTECWLMGKVNESNQKSILSGHRGYSMKKDILIDEEIQYAKEYESYKMRSVTCLDR